MSLFLFQLIIIIMLAVREEAPILAKLVTHIFPFLIYCIILLSLHRSYSLQEPLTRAETTWVKWSSLFSFLSLPFLVSILSHSGSPSLLKTRAEGDWMLSQIHRVPCGHSCPLSQSHSICKGGFVSPPLTCLKYRCLYLGYMPEALSIPRGRKRHG